ncbi:tetratricopeptide repeat protein [Candidatus Woesearchaeota archaeon]|nr:tetratricopeptide repeat protein [Candidatus Woesearchaeota archaeon]
MRKKEVGQKNIVIFILIAIVAIVLIWLNSLNKEEAAEKGQIAKTGNPFQALQQANELYNNANYVEAIRQYRQIIESEPKNYYAYINLGHSYLQLGIHQDALKTFNKTFDLGYLDFRTFYGLGLTYYRMEDYNKAYVNLKQAYELNPNNNAVVSYLINTYNALGLYDEAIRLAEEKLKNDPNNSHHYRKIAISYFLKNDLPKALENAKKAVELNGDYAPNRMTLGTVDVSLGKQTDALNEFNEVLTLVKSNPVYEGLSVFYYLLGDTENSEKNAKLSNFYPAHSNSLSLYGFALVYLKDYEKSIEEFNKAADSNPNYYLPYKGLGKAYIELGQKEKAIENFEKAAKLNDLDEETKKLLEEAKR